MATPDPSTAASRLCARCGMCCNGVMFDIVRLQAGESPKALAALGLKVKRKRGHSHIVQPCTAHRDSQCAVYEERPARCRLFECLQLQRVASGEITEDVAQEKIASAVRLVAEVNALLLQTGGSNERRSLSKRCEQAMADAPDGSPEPAASGVRSQLEHAKRELDKLLDEEFRIVPADTEA